MKTLEWLVEQEPRATLRDLADVWNGLSAANLIPAWNSEIEQLANARVQKAVTVV